MAPPVFGGEEEKTQAAGLLHTILLTILGATILYGLFTPLPPNAALGRLFYLSAFIGFSLALLYLTRRGQVRFAAAFLVIGMWLLLTISLMRGGISGAYSAYLITILCAGLLLGERAAMFWAVASILVGLVSLLGGRLGWLPRPNPTFDPVAVWVTLSLYILIAALLLSLALRSISRALQRARLEIAERERTEQELRRLHEEVQHYADELEQRVAARTHELAQANEQLKALDRMKSKFISDVSHELRTPVTSLKLHVDLLERGRKEKQVYYLDVLRQQCDRLQQLIEDILNLSRLELGRDRVAFGPVDLNRVVLEVIKVHRPQAAGAGLELKCELAADLPPVWGEVNQLSQIVTNLLTNALNYTSKGWIVITTSQLNGQGWLQVKDSGVGIEQEDLPHLFDRFYRGRHTVDKEVPGTGLGLAIVKEIVELHNGRIEVESEVGNGSTFLVRLPLAPKVEKLS